MAPMIEEGTAVAVARVCTCGCPAATASIPSAHLRWCPALKLLPKKGGS